MSAGIGRTLDRTVLVGGGLFAALLVAIAVLTYRNTRQLNDDAGWVAHTNQVLDLTGEVLLALVDAETGQRGFLLTGRDEYLEPYNSALKRLDGLLATLKDETRDNRPQQDRIARLEEMIATRLAGLEQAIGLRRKSEKEAQASVLNGVAKAQMDAIRELVGEMRNRESELLGERRRRSSLAYQTAVIAGLVTALAGLGLVAAFVRLLQRGLLARQQAAAVLHEQREWFRTTLAGIGDAVIATDTEGNVRFLNSVAQDLTAWKEHEAEGQPLESVFKIINEQTRKTVENPALRALKEGVVVGLANHTVLIARDGTERAIDDSAAPIRDANGKMIGAVLVFRDITERKRAEQEVARLFALEQERSERLRQVAAASLTINSATTPASVVDVIRAEAKRIIGTRHSEVSLQCEEQVPDGALCAALIGRGGRLLGRISLAGKTNGGFTQDDKAILTQLAHMAAVAYDNARLYEELRESDRRKDEFLATLAHELRNPLAPIRNSIHVMRLAGHDRGTIDGSRAMIERQVQQMVRLVDDLLDVSRISRGQIELRTEQIELASVLTSAVETSRPLIEQSGHELTIAWPQEPIPLVADPSRMAQVFSNLLNNAAKYTERGGHIWLSAQRDDGGVTVRVRDSGVGISPEMLPRIFEMFTQVDHSLERAQGGLGIGLTLVKRLVEMHGGSIEAHSEGPKQGSEFVVRLPVALDLEPEQPATAGGHHAATRPHRRILVVDDNQDSADSLAMMLNILGNEVRTAHDGLEAVDLAATFNPEVVLMDIGLPMLNGYDAARRMRVQPGGNDMVLVALTGWGQEEDRRRSHEAGFDRHIVKPVDPFALEKLLDELETTASRTALEH